MPIYSFVVWTKRSRVKYPESFYLPDVEAAHQAARRIARVFGDVAPQWDDLSYDHHNNFAVEVVDEASQTVLTVPCKKAEELSPLRDQDYKPLKHKEAPPGLLN